MGPIQPLFDGITDDPAFARTLATPCFVIACVLLVVVIWSRFRERMPTLAVVQSSLRSLAARLFLWRRRARHEAAPTLYGQLKSVVLAKQEWASRASSLLILKALWTLLLLLRMASLVLFFEAVVFWAPYGVDFFTCFIWFVLAAGSILFSRRLTPALADAVFTADFVVLILKFRCIEDFQALQAAYLSVQFVRLFFSSQIESLRLVTVANVGLAMQLFLHVREMRPGHEVAMMLSADISIGSVAVAGSIVVRRYRARESRFFVESLWANRQLTAAHAMLHVTYDVVLELDEGLRYVSDEGGKTLAAFLLRSPNVDMFKEGGVFSAVLGQSERTLFEELVAPQAGDQPMLKSFTAGLQDGNGRVVPVDILTVACEACTVRQGFLVGIRENSEGLRKHARSNTPQPVFPQGAAEGMRSTRTFDGTPSAASSPSALSSSAAPRAAESGPPSAASSAPLDATMSDSFEDDCFPEQCVWRVCAPIGGRRSWRSSPKLATSRSQSPSTSSEGSRKNDSPRSCSALESTMAASGGHPSRCGSQEQHQQQQKLSSRSTGSSGNSSRTTVPVVVEPPAAGVQAAGVTEADAPRVDTLANLRS